MDPSSILAMLVVGALAGWLAGMVMSGGGFGLIGNIIVGIIGAVVAGWLFPTLGVSIGGPLIGAIINSAIGAILVLFVIGLFKRG